MGWTSLPDLIFIDIMMKVGLENLEGLHRCRQVCKTWDEKILSEICQRKRKIMKERIEKAWGPGMLPSNEEISHAKWAEAGGILDTNKIERLTERVRKVFEEGSIYMEKIDVLKCGASLAHHGLLNSVKDMTIGYVDLSKVPTEVMASLVSCVASCIEIRNDTGCDMVSLLSSLKCQSLSIKSHSLGREDTRTLVRAMESQVESVTLCEGVTLDIEILLEYSGQGLCRNVWLWYDTAERYREDLRTWTKRRNWKIDVDKELMALHK